MKYKKGLIFIFLILFFLSIAGVCASDAGEVNIQTGNSTVDDVVALDVDSDENDDAIASDVVNGQDMMAISDEHEILNSGFKDLQDYIDAAYEGSEIHIHNNYTLQKGEGSIIISKSITINGDNNFIKGSDKDTIFKIVADGKSVTLKNLLIQNGKTSGNGGAILNTHSSTNLTLIDCEFRDNHADDDGGAIFTTGNLLIVHTNFYNNHADSEGGAIRSEGAIRIYGSQLNDNSASNAVHKSLGGAISSVGDCYIENGDFKKNHADNYGGAIFSIGALTIANSTFIANEVADGGGAINSRGVTVISDTKFKNNKARVLMKAGEGGAIKSDNVCTLNSCTFDHNWADCGGAIYAVKELKINGNSKFINQNGLYANYNLGSGGAIYCEQDLYINWNNDNDSFCEMTSNVVNNFGGAIFCLKSVFGKNLKFQNNDVLDYACGNHLGGGAIACFREIHIKNSEFLDNHVFIKFNGIDPPSPSQPVPYDFFSSPTEGGAIRCGGKCYIESCTFNGNSAFRGGAIYTTSDLIITGHDNKFINNMAKFDGPTYDSSSGGAILCGGNLKVDGASFTGNEALVDGGAIYCNGTCEISNSEFNNSKIDDSGAFFSNVHKCYGGAICSEGEIILNKCNFSNNHADNNGGAIYAYMNIRATNCNFIANTAKVDGGAIYSPGEVTVSGSIFEGNRATGATSHQSWGGAIHSKGLISIDKCSFNNNYAYNWGGAVYADGEIKITNSKFTYNLAQHAGAVYASTINHLSNSVFSKNQATSGEGGAVFIYDECNPEFNSCKFEENSCTDKGGAIYVGTTYFHIKTYSCSFTNNHAGDIGGAIYAGGGITKSDMGIKDSTFTGNSAKSGGAVHISKVTEITGSSFFNNTATEKNGGAVYINFPCDPVVSSCTFKGNTAHYEGGGICVGSKYCNLKISDSTFDDNHVKGYGGAVYLDCDEVVFSTTEITNSRFTSNSAQRGGAVFTGGIKGALSNSVFIGNKANWGEGDKDGNGGAINIFNRGPIEIVSCRFEQNYAYNVGGAVYIDSSYKTTHLKVSYCTFVDNQADSKKYSGKHYCGPGHSIFNCGWYDLIDMCWFGKNDPDFKWDHYFHRQFVEKRSGRDDLDHTPTNILKISMNINETEIYKNNSYKVTVHFENGLSKDLLHSRGTFDGDGNFSNINADRNDMTTEVILTIDKPTLYGRLDHQTVSLNLNAKDKEPSKVIIISCDDVNYPNPVNVTYEISGMADSASYVIKNDLGEIVKEGKIASPNNLLVENLTLGAYSITLNNPESRTHLASCNNTTFNVNKGNIDLRIVVLNETYPEDVECDIYASVDGEYQLSIAGCSTTVVVKDHVAHFHRGTLDANTYEAIISFEGNDFYYPASNRTTFTVSLEGTNFEIEINPSEVIYGEDATVIHSITDGATGIIKYYLHNGTFLGESSVDDNFTLPVLNVGSYLIIANYTGDNNHRTASDTAHVIVNKGKPAFKLETALVSYGDNGTAIPILPDVATGSIKYYLENGTFLGELSVNENLTMPAWNVGTYLILAQYSGDKNFFNATANATLIVNKGKTEITAFPVIATYKDNDYLLITLRNHNGNPIVGFNVTVMFNGAGNYTTNENGQINISTINLGAGTYNVTFNFDGSENYWNCSNATQVFINTRPSIMTVAPFTTTYQVHKYLIVNLKDDLGNPITNTNTFMTVHGITYHAKTDSKGDARLIIRLDPKNYIGTLTFDNNNYTLSLGFVKITVLKATPKITAKNKKFKASKKVKKYTVILKDNIGKAMSKVKVTLKIKGKTYKATTNSKGKATFKIKKLTKNGKYKATVTFNGNFRFNKVTKKVKITCTK